MKRDKKGNGTLPQSLPSLFRGLYGRVARQLKIDPSYVSRVARGERQSQEISEALDTEIRRIAKFMANGGRGAAATKKTKLARAR